MKTFPYGVIGPSTAPDIADRILDEVSSIAGKMGIKLCLACGLCLGFVRDGAYLEGDNDLDMIAIADDRERFNLSNALISAGFMQGWSFEWQATHFVKDRILVDIVWRKREGFYSEFGSVKYKGKTYPIPCRIDEYLIACYGRWEDKNDRHESKYEG